MFHRLRNDGDGDNSTDYGLLRSQFDPIIELCGIPAYLSSSFWRYLTEDWVSDGVHGRDYRVVRSKRLSFDRFQAKWTDLIQRFHDDESALMFEVLKGGRPGLKALSGESFELVVEDVVMNHRELNFLQGNSVFQRRYSTFHRH